MAANTDSPRVTFDTVDASSFAAASSGAAAVVLTDAGKGDLSDASFYINASGFIQASGEPSLSKPSMHTALAVLKQAPVWCFRVADGALASSSFITTLELDLTMTGTITTPAVGLTPATYSAAQLTATSTRNDGSLLDVTNSASWSSSNEAVATVGVDGSVVGIADGSAIITAEYQGVTATKTISIELV